MPSPVHHRRWTNVLKTSGNLDGQGVASDALLRLQPVAVDVRHPWQKLTAAKQLINLCPKRIHVWPLWQLCDHAHVVPQNTH